MMKKFRAWFYVEAKDEAEASQKIVDLLQTDHKYDFDVEEIIEDEDRKKVDSILQINTDDEVEN